MPLMTDPDKYGDLIIEFDVEYPHRLNPDQKLYIKEALLNNQTNKKHQHNQNRKKNLTHED
jgi:DnaJ-class molecular chaperone